MNILFLTNNSITQPLIEFLQNSKESVNIYSKTLTTDIVDTYFPDILVSYNYKYIIKKEVIEKIDGRVINLHISYLPWNRGAQPNFWSFIDDTPKGVTIHLIDEGLDTGAILLQKEFNFNERTETLKSTYSFLHSEIQKLFIENWYSLKNFTIKPKSQNGSSSTHNVKDFVRIQKIIGGNIWDLKIIDLKLICKDIL